MVDFTSEARSILWLLALGIVTLLPVQSGAQSTSVYAHDFLRASASPETLLAPAATAALSNYYFRPAGFGSGGEGLGLHYGVSLADNVSGKFLRKYTFALISNRQDNYCPVGAASPWKARLRNAALHSLFSVPQTSKAFNWSALPASITAAAFSNIYQPSEQRSWTSTLQRFGTNAGGYLLGDMLAEVTFKPKQNLAVRFVIGVR